MEKRIHDLIHKEEVYKIIGLSMKVHWELGRGFSEIVYKDALEIEFIENGIPYVREKIHAVDYIGRILPHKFKSDFFVFEKIILEIKAAKDFHFDDLGQVLNYLNASKIKLGLMINFGRKSLQFKRLICSEC
jgi:GxxExxY protein